MVDIEHLPNRPLTEGEFNDFVETQDTECPLAFHSYCTHCDTGGIANALMVSQLDPAMHLRAGRRADAGRAGRTARPGTHAGKRQKI